jgi:hypothetical protein
VDYSCLDQNLTFADAYPMAKKRKKPEPTVPKRGRPFAGGKEPMRSFRVSDAEWDDWKRAAEASGAKSLAEWIRGVVNKAASRVQ